MRALEFTIGDVIYNLGLYFQIPTENHLEIAWLRRQQFMPNLWVRGYFNPDFFNPGTLMSIFRIQ